MWPLAALSEPVPRRRLHTRQVVCEGFEREDGLFDVEGRLCDTKSYDVGGVAGGAARVAGEPIHLMSIRLTLDGTCVIVGVQVRTHQAPFSECADINAAYDGLIGLRIEAGFTLAVKRRFRGVAGCTHLTELLGPVATTALQSVRSAIARRPDAPGQPLLQADQSHPPRLLDTCWGLRSGSPAAIARWGDIAKVGPGGSTGNDVG